MVQQILHTLAVRANRIYYGWEVLIRGHFHVIVHFFGEIIMKEMYATGWMATCILLDIILCIIPQMESSSAKEQGMYTVSYGIFVCMLT